MAATSQSPSQQSPNQQAPSDIAVRIIRRKIGLLPLVFILFLRSAVAPMGWKT